MSFTPNDHRIVQTVPLVTEHILTMNGSATGTFIVGSTTATTESFSVSNARRINVAYSVPQIKLPSTLGLFPEFASARSGAEWHSHAGEAGITSKGGYTETLNEGSYAHFFEVAGRYCRLRLTAPVDIETSFKISRLKVWAQS